MKLRNKIKLLSLAIVGFGGLALAGTSAAACPAGPDAANGGAWTSKVALQGNVAIASPGLAGTACLMTSKINVGASAIGRALVFDDSPSNESRYRASFVVDLDSMAAPGFADRIQIFSATPSSQSSPLSLTVFGSSNSWSLSYVLPDASSPGGVTSGVVPLAAGPNHIEFDLSVGASGSFALWVNSDTEASPTVAAITVDDSSMGGVEGAYLGLAQPTANFVSKFGGVAAQFDQFDSRRSTFIGY